MENRKIPVVFICDDGYVTPTCVAITSLILSKKKDTVYDVYIVCASLSEENEAIFRRYEDQVNIHIIRENAERFSHLHNTDEKAICVATPAALLKFVLPGLISEYDKVIYLDGDLIVRDDLTELYQTELNKNYLAAVADSGTIYYKTEVNQRVAYYFNSGVMLLNLKQMREDNLSEVLIRKKQEMNDSNLMDQNVFNVVCDGRVMPLPVRYNLLPVNLVRAYGKWTIEQINEKYQTSYSDVGMLFADAAVVHFSSKDKPWKVDTVVFADEWYYCYHKALIQHTLTRSAEKPLAQIASPKVSVIIPVYNAEAYMRETLDSIRNQTLQDIEIICVDDGSTDNSLGILREYEKLDSRFRVYHQENAGQGKARNFALTQAKGTYVHFMDSDDLLELDAMDRLVESAAGNNLDILCFNGVSFYENSDVEKNFSGYSTLYHRKKIYPYVYSGQQLYVMQTFNWDFAISPCMKLYRKDYLIEHQISFPEGILNEDIFFAIQAMNCAKRAKVINYAPYHRRVHEGSTMTIVEDQERCYARYVAFHTIACKILEFMKDSSLTREAKMGLACHVEMMLQKTDEYYEKLDEERRGWIQTDDRIATLDYQMLKPILIMHKLNFRDGMTVDMEKASKANIENHSLEREVRILKKELQDMENSAAFRMGRMLTLIPRMFRSFINSWKENGFGNAVHLIFSGEKR